MRVISILALVAIASAVPCPHIKCYHNGNSVVTTHKTNNNPGAHGPEAKNIHPNCKNGSTAGACMASKNVKHKCTYNEGTKKCSCSCSIDSSTTKSVYGFESGISTSNQQGWDKVHNWVRVNFQQKYKNPIVVAGIPSHVGPHEVIVSVKGVDSKGFYFHLHETACRDNGKDWHMNEQISWLVAEEGTHLIGGKVMVAGKKTKVKASTWTQINMGNAFTPGSNPTILSQIQDASTHDYYVNIRHKNADHNSFEVYSQYTNAASGKPRGDETVGYLAVQDSAVSVANHRHFAAGITKQDRDEKNRWINLGKDFSHNNYALFGSIHTFGGGDPAKLRYHKKENNRALVFIEEDTCGDKEVLHPGLESISFLAAEVGMLEAVVGATPDPCTALSGYHQKCSNPDAAWVPKKARDGGCQVHVFTKGTTCKSYCKAQGGVCLRGQDNRHQAGDNGCVLDPNHGRQSQADNGCNQQWNDQVCVCDVKATEVVNTDKCKGMTGFHQKCSNSKFSWAVSVGVGMGHDGCEVHVFTRGGTCAQYCKGQNKKCIGGQDNRHQPGDNGCVLDPNHRRQSEAADGCNQRWNDQVCICK